MTRLSVTEVLLAYDGPLVVVANDGVGESAYVGINYDDGETAHLFHFAKVSQSNLQQLYDQRIDVRYLITKLRQGRHFLGEGWGNKGEKFIVKKVLALEPEWLPETGMFIAHQSVPGVHTELKTVQIDGRWGIDDLRKFSDLVQDAYAFVYALSGIGAASTKQKMGILFRKYPWRGGFSSVNFFDDLYSIIPSGERAQVRKIQYASPGTIQLKMDGTVAASIRDFVSTINTIESTATKAYSDARSTLRLRGWLGKAKDDLELTNQDEAMLLILVGKLSVAFGLSGQTDEIVSFANSDPLGAVKILLAYYRRLAGLADYVATGKAQELFT
ncbi:hypothetical protein J2X19_002323 [Rhodoferax ferrireducens]|uniref:DUF6575 domain-containing protein n=1 Tax=Rhodoferax ferrireducens TaxID=192843 RepID=A0ABU2C8N2_9BURK|nr:hypothetical protein [Rhodoferax ferrireducens]MDR7377644.1 hypothetical protein [Rhodoferax ferrireducens]